MINPSTVNPLALPSLPLADRRLLPCVAAVYIVLKGDRILYVGRSNNLLHRWCSHQRWYQLKDRGEKIRIAWFECSDSSLLPALETALVVAFEPELNASQKGLPNGASRVTELRRKANLTQRELADIVGVTETTIRNWENNRSGSDWFERVAKLCEALECTPKELFEYKSVEKGEVK